MDAPGDHVEARLHFSPQKSEIMKDTIGFCTISTAPEGKYVADPDFWKGKTCRVVDITIAGDVLVKLDNKIGAFEAKDVVSIFRCQMFADVICSPEISFSDQMLYYKKIMNRKGGYNSLLRDMIISVSLRNGKFTDDFVFAGSIQSTPQL
ncbi:hypothetical protein SDC9_58950 [bioreactor metagenome]|uniref:Uncharacterized protein n=1 Tax=bioreactor metagenome TaxID=1076179 RepID=A0A644X8T8_9ZZZZ